jgi:hypothetical protein
MCLKKFSSNFTSCIKWMPSTDIRSIHYLQSIFYFVHERITNSFVFISFANKISPNIVAHKNTDLAVNALYKWLTPGHLIYKRPGWHRRFMSPPAPLIIEHKLQRIVINFFCLLNAKKYLCKLRTFNKSRVRTNTTPLKLGNYIRLITKNYASLCLQKRQLPFKFISWSPGRH